MANLRGTYYYKNQTLGSINFQTFVSFFSWLFKLYYFKPTNEQLQNLSFFWICDSGRYNISFQELAKQFEDNENGKYPFKDNDMLILQIKEKDGDTRIWFFPKPKHPEKLIQFYEPLYIPHKNKCECYQPLYFSNQQKCDCHEREETLLEFIFCGEWLVLDSYLYIGLPRSCSIHKTRSIVYCNMATDTFCSIQTDPRHSWWIITYLSELHRKRMFSIFDSVKKKGVYPLKTQCMKQILDYQTIDKVPPYWRHPLLEKTSKVLLYLKALQHRLQGKITIERHFIF